MTAEPAPGSAAGSDEGASDARFGSLVRDHFDALMEARPTLATYLGIHAHDGRLADLSREAAEAHIASERGFSCVLDWRSDPLQARDRGQVIGMNEMQAKLATRAVLWAREDVDLTQAVIDALKPKDEKKDEKK